MREHLRQRLSRVSLRARLTAITVLLVAVGLFGAGLATHHFLRAFLMDRVDQQLAQAQRPVLRVLVHPEPGDDLPLPPGSYVALLGPNGGTHTPLRIAGTTRSAPSFLADADAGYSTAHGYRLLVAQLSDLPRPDLPASGRLVIAIPLADMQSTLNRLTLLELAIGAVVVVVVGGLALLLVRIGFRPLRRIEETAGAIAAGDLGRRIEGAEPSTEVGRLGGALNAMLGQIEQAFRAREASEERLRRFVGDASHELRTPLTSVRGYAELFRRGAAERSDDLELVMRRIEDEAARMGVLVEDLLLLARLDEGRPLERSPVDLSALLAELVEDSRTLHPQWPITITTSEEALVAVGDELRLRQAVANLLSNARSHCPAGTPVHVRLLRRAGEAVIEVEDEGPGIAPKDAEHVFERFFRVDESRARASGGSGLGLSIVASIVEAHGGRTELESELGRGSTFRLVLPAAEQPPAKERARRRTRAGTPSGPR